MALIHFLLVYDFTKQRLVYEGRFDDAEEAGTEYARLEAEYRGNPDYEIVLVGADSIETIRTTHGHYFDGDAPASSSPYLSGV
jgi:hypothetical protein